MLPLGTDSERDSERWGWGGGGGKAREGVREREGEGGGRSGLGGADSDSDSESSNPGMTVGLRLASGPGGRYSGSIRNRRVRRHGNRLSESAGGSLSLRIRTQGSSR